MKKFVIAISLFALSACVKVPDPAKQVCIDGILHQETSPDSGIYLPVDRLANGEIVGNYKCVTVDSAKDIAKNTEVKAY